LKIAIDCRFWGPKHTGLGRYTENLVKNLLKIDKNNHYIFLVREQPELKSKAIINYQITDCLPYSLKEQFLLPGLLKRIKPDLVHFPHFNVPIFCPFPYVVNIHDLIKHYSRGLKTTTRQPWTYLIKYWGYKYVFAKAVKRARKIIVPTKLVKKQLLGYYKIPADKVVVTYYGGESKLKVNPPAGGEKPSIQAQTKGLKVLRKYNLKKPFLLYVGNVYPHKNIRRLILAVKMINQLTINNQQLTINLVIVCARDVFWQRLKRTVSEFKAESFVSLPDFIPDKELKMLYSQAKAFISPSLMEGFGLPGLEAMASGCPVVCSNIPVFKEVYGKAAVFFNPQDVEDMKREIMKVINLSSKERQELIKKGKTQANKYSWHKCARETLKIYESCLSL